MRTTPRPQNAVAVLCLRGRRLAGVAVLLVLTAAMLVAGSPGPPQLRDSPDPGAAQRQPWRASYSRRFPGCVALLLWPRDEQPRALVVRAPDGRLELLSVREAALTAGHGRFRTLGACR